MRAAYLIRRLSESVSGADLIQRHVITREEATVYNKHLVRQHSTQRQAAEDLGEELYCAFVVLGPHLSFESVQAVHGFCLVVSPSQVDAWRTLGGQHRSASVGAQSARARCRPVGYRHLSAKSVKMTSTEKEPRSTKSPGSDTQAE